MFSSQRRISSPRSGRSLSGLRLLHCREVPAPVVLRPLHDAVRPVREVPQQADDEAVAPHVSHAVGYRGERLPDRRHHRTLGRRPTDLERRLSDSVFESVPQRIATTRGRITVLDAERLADHAG